MSNIQEQINKEREEARKACSIDDKSPECAAAWDAVEELQAEAAHQQQANPVKNDFEKYCEDNPDADECRVYED